MHDLGKSDRGDLPKSRPYALLRQCGGGRFFHVDFFHSRKRRPAPAEFAQRLDGLRGTGEKRFYIAVRTIAHPASDAALLRLALCPGAIADALNQAADGDADNALRLWSNRGLVRTRAMRINHSFIS